MRAYASGLDFHLSDADMMSLFGQAPLLGFNALQGQGGPPGGGLGHPPAEAGARGGGGGRHADGGRERGLVAGARRCGGCTLTSGPGFDILWIEDPCLRFDFDGLREISRQAPFTLVNTGEYLGLSDKRRLIEARGGGYPEYSRQHQRRHAGRLAGARARHPGVALAIPAWSSACTWRRRCRPTRGWNTRS